MGLSALFGVEIEASEQESGIAGPALEQIQKAFGCVKWNEAGGLLDDVRRQSGTFG